MYGFKKKIYSAVAVLLLAAPLLYTGCASSGDTAQTQAKEVEQGKAALSAETAAGTTATEESVASGAGAKVADGAVVKKKKKRKRRQRKSRYGESYFPNIELTNQDGKKVRFYDDLIKDKVVSINFIFTSCQNVCPLETARLREVYNLLEDRIGKDLFMYSITVDPARDSPEVLKAYMKKFEIGPGWQFLTGKKEEIDALRVKLGLYIQDLDETLPDGQIDHNISLVMGNQKTGQWMKRSPYEDAKLLATMFGDWLTNWNSRNSAVGNSDFRKSTGLAVNYSDGEFLYRTRCLTCHSLGRGDGIGPDLLGVLQRRDREWLARWIMEPNVMIKEKDPIIMEMMKKYNDIAMPNLRLNKLDVTSLFRFLESVEAGYDDSAIK